MTTLPWCDGLAATASADPWMPWAAQLRGLPEPRSSEAYGALYQRAIEEGARALRGFSAIDPASRADLSVLALSERLSAILGAQRPRAYFRRVVRRYALSWLRSPRSRVAEECPDLLGDDEQAMEARIDLKRALGMLRPRERQAIELVFEGHSREDVAHTMRTTRANVDQILCRARRRVAAGLSAREGQGSALAA